MISAEDVSVLIADLVSQPGALLPILHRVQEHLGYVPAEAVPVIAKALNLSRAEVHGVVTFYHEFREAPAGAHVFKVCQAEACQAMGSEQVTQHLERRLRTKLGETRADHKFTLEPIYCLGLCSLSPAAMVDGALVGRATAERLDTLVDRMEDKR
ncbi:MAG TPA: formate dehydrogenase subunit gamma [bacterium]